MAAFAGMTLKDYILAKTLPATPKGNDTTDELPASPKNAARLREAIGTPQADHHKFASIDELKDALGI